MAPTKPRPASLLPPAAFFVGNGVAVAETDGTSATMVLDAAATSVVGGSSCHLAQSSPRVVPASIIVLVGSVYAQIHKSKVLF